MKYKLTLLQWVHLMWRNIWILSKSIWLLRVYFRLYHGIDISRPLRQLAKGGRCWGSKPTELQKLFACWMTPYNSKQRPCSCRKRCNNVNHMLGQCVIVQMRYLWRSAVLFYEATWNPRLGTNVVKGVQQNPEKHLLFGRAVINMKRHWEKELQTSQLVTEDQTVVDSAHVRHHADGIAQRYSSLNSRCFSVVWACLIPSQLIRSVYKTLKQGTSRSHDFEQFKI